MPHPTVPCDKEMEVCKVRHAALKQLVELHEEKMVCRLGGMDEALRLRTADIERRLNLLNQLREEVVVDRDRFLNKETYDIKTTFYDNWCATVNDRLTRIETRSVVWTAALAIFFILVEFAFRMWPITAIVRAP